jgi:hypothetical protein
LNSGTGTYCPNSGLATIDFTAQIRVTKVAGTSLGPSPCTIPITLGVAFSTEAGGTRFNQPSPHLLANLKLGNVDGLGNCNPTMKALIVNYYGLNTSGTVSADFHLFDAVIDPTNFTGTGC